MPVKKIKLSVSGRPPAEVPPEVFARVLGWMQEKGVGEVWLEPVGEGYGVRFNLYLPSPGAYLPASALCDAEAFLETLEEALNIYYEELNLRE
jgi:hypothetical protein